MITYLTKVCSNEPKRVPKLTCLCSIPNQDVFQIWMRKFGFEYLKTPINRAYKHNNKKFLWYTYTTPTIYTVYLLFLKRIYNKVMVIVWSGVKMTETPINKEFFRNFWNTKWLDVEHEMVRCMTHFGLLEHKTVSYGTQNG